MWLIADLQRLFKNESWQDRIAYAVLLLLAVLYLLSQVAMAIVWLATEAQVDNL
jgi:hypothetical protein